MTLLVLKKFTLNENQDEFLKIEGRASGILSWLLSLCGIDPVTSLSCNKQAIKFESSSIRQGKTTLNVPLVAVTGVSSGIAKPFALLVLGIIFIFGGIIGAILLERGEKAGSFFFGVIVGAIFLIFYSLKKAMQFSIYNGGDKPIATLHFKKSIIEGQNIDESKYESAANALSKAVLEIHYILTNIKESNTPYEKTSGAAQDTSKAAGGYEKAVPREDANTQYNTGAAQSTPKTAEEYEEAARQGDAKAQATLGLMYANGNGVTKDMAKAARWLEKAALQGEVNAQYYLGLLYEKGVGVVRDLAKAAEWYEKAARQGHTKAKTALMRCTGID